MGLGGCHLWAVHDYLAQVTQTPAEAKVLIDYLMTLSWFLEISQCFSLTH